jgi:hypothetical protein
MPPQPWSRTTAGKGPSPAGFFRLPVNVSGPVKILVADVLLNEIMFGSASLSIFTGTVVWMQDMNRQMAQKNNSRWKNGTLPGQIDFMTMSVLIRTSSLTVEVYEE